MTLSLNALYSTLLQDLMPHLPEDFYTSCVKSSGETPTLESLYEQGVMANLQPRSFASIALINSLFKKYEGSVNADANDLAFDKFVTADVSCDNWRFRPASFMDEHLLGEFRDSLYRFFFPSNKGPSILAFPSEFFELGGVGPGASVGARGTDFYTKLFDGPLTSTSEGLYRMYRNYIQTSPSLEDAESCRLERYGPVTIVEGSKLSFVPKNDHISRVICTEPVLNMWAQKGVGELITRRLKSAFGIDLSTQPDINRELARKGSIDGDLSTIDLSSASDSISLRMCRHFLPQPVMDVIEALRSPRTKLNPKDFVESRNKDLAESNGGWLDLDMVSSMGNGFTFPLETAIFACVVDAAYKVFEIPLVRNKPSKGELGNFGVFGDDIICNSDVARHVIRLLELLGFTTNASKTFVEGPFRESCGGDYFRGHPVRGVYIKSLGSMASRYVAINRLNEWSAVTDIGLSKTISYLLGKVRLLPIPLHENDDAGIKVTHSFLRDLIAVKRNKKSFADLCRKRFKPVLGETLVSLAEYNMAGYQPDVLSLPWDLKSIARDQNGAYLYRRAIANPRRVTFLEDAIVTPKGAKLRNYNPEGALQAFLHGNIEAGTVTIRHDRVRYLTKMARTPMWDFVPTAGSKDPVGPVQWDTALWLNLMV